LVLRAVLPPPARRPPKRDCAEAGSLRQMIETRAASRVRPLGFVPSSSRAGIPPEGREVLSSANPAHRHVGGDQALGPGVGWEQRLETLETRIEHLEGALEGLQDAVYRQAVLGGEKIRQVRRRIEPEQMARALSRDARRRGL
jgi:hypothetical protein